MLEFATKFVSVEIVSHGYPFCCRSEPPDVANHLMDGQYSSPIRIVSFNTSEGWSRDASEDIAEELQRRCAECGEVPPSLDGFLKAHGRGVDIQLMLL
ncbi:hypothetical protein ACT4MK_08090 [Bradyrhizobium barranii]|uniref:hypothetical protein n=1 Tax=Bradyrhizobium TaxID=374 RepID=UPI003397AB2C